MFTLELPFDGAIMERSECPLDHRHGPHDAGALFCWVCGAELHCTACGLSVLAHQFVKQQRCPVYRLQPLSEPSLL